MKSAILAVLLTLGSSAAFAQVGQDLKTAGAATKDAATTATDKTVAGTKKVYHKSTKVAKKGVHKTAKVTKKAADKVSNKTSDTGTH